MSPQRPLPATDLILLLCSSLYGTVTLSIPADKWQSHDTHPGNAMASLWHVSPWRITEPLAFGCQMDETPEAPLDRAGGEVGVAPINTQLDTGCRVRTLGRFVAVLWEGWARLVGTPGPGLQMSLSPG